MGDSMVIQCPVVVYYTLHSYGNIQQYGANTNNKRKIIEQHNGKVSYIQRKQERMQLTTHVQATEI